jgi:hypothetical protein
MVLVYGPRHARRWRVPRQCSIPLPQARLQAIHAWTARRRAPHPAPLALTVRDTGSAGCAAALGPLAQSPSATTGWHWSEG